MTDTVQRLHRILEPILALDDPRPRLSAYHDMPCAIFRYDLADEFLLRKELRLLGTRLARRGKRVHRVSLAECLADALEAEAPIARLAEAERSIGLGSAIDTVHAVLSEYAPLVDLVAARLPRDPDPTRDVVFVVRAGALFPVYRTFALLEQLKGRVLAPTVLFYPGVLDGPAGLRFMGVLEADHKYRPKIF